MFKRIDHVVIATEDLADAAQRWVHNLGLEAEAPVRHPQGAGFQVSRLPVSDAFLELVQPVTDTGRFAQQFRERGEGLFSVSLEVDNLGAATAHLREKGAQVSEPEPGIWPGTRVARISRSSAHGVSIQLIERRDRLGR
jgi:catechol 2,3-dioxygenase-like lactoylglutathione lyase family enzyme